MEVVMMILHLLNGEVAKIPVALALNQSCNDKFITMVEEDSIGTSVYYNGVKVWAYYCKEGNGEWVK